MLNTKLYFQRSSNGEDNNCIIDSLSSSYGVLSTNSKPPCYRLMKRFGIVRSLIFGATLFGLSSNCLAGVFLKNEGIVDSRAVKQIELMGAELKQKTGVNTYVVAIKSLGKVRLVTYEENLAKDLKKPYILLALSKNDMQVDIKASADMLDKFDRAGVLSPYPLKGTILPILGDKKGKDKCSAALLNGFADIVDQVASSYSVKLDSSIGRANKNVILIIKAIFYFLAITSIVMVFYYKRKRKNATE